MVFFCNMQEIVTPLGHIHLEDGPGHNTCLELRERNGDGQEKECGTALLVHGYRGWHGSWMMKLLAEGICVRNMRMDMPGVALSGGVYSASPLDDAAAVKETLKALHARGTRVNIAIGHSRGAVAVLTAAAELEEDEHDLEKIICIAPRYHHEYVTLGGLDEEQRKSLKENGYFYEEFKEIMGGQKVKITHQMLMDRVDYDNKTRCQLLRKRYINVLFIHGSEDKISPEADIEQFLTDINTQISPDSPELNCKITLKVIPGADHGFKEFGDQLIQAINDFLLDK